EGQACPAPGEGVESENADGHIQEQTEKVSGRLVAFRSDGLDASCLTVQEEGRSVETVAFCCPTCGGCPGGLARGGAPVRPGAAEGLPDVARRPSVGTACVCTYLVPLPQGSGDEQGEDKGACGEEPPGQAGSRAQFAPREE